MAMELRRNENDKLVPHYSFTVRIRDCISNEIDEFELWATSVSDCYAYVLRFNQKCNTNHEILNVWRNK